ncbi:hypothetical protein [Magnetospirillum fulvum]|uniref:Uncharacterized protein n=1 Tax=Magnetospirillum fulvum TaxID=1082 RepID=A0A1H6HJ29_MAGFU|nr:hypothetical protein [Magnetospirillum fulvum]SEH35456.1 hypothetical protein SAMN04244559_01779 [Magnetospirillum fulvum]
MAETIHSTTFTNRTNPPDNLQSGFKAALTSSSPNRLDTLDTAQSLASLLSDLILSRDTSIDFRLSPSGADGMAQIIGFLRESMEEATIGLEQAQNELAEANASAEQVDEAYRRGYGDGFSIGTQSAPISGSPVGRETLKWWARMGCSIGYRRGLRRHGIHNEDAYRDISDLAQGMVDVAYDFPTDIAPLHPPILNEDGADRRDDDAPPADTGPIPDLTEPLTEAEHGGIAASA